MHALLRVHVVLCPRKRIQAPAPVRLAAVAQVHGSGIVDAHHGRGVKALADLKTLGQMLVRGCAANHRGAVLRAHPSGEALVLLKVGLHGFGVDTGFASCVFASFGWLVTNHLGPLAIKVDQFLAFGLALRRVAAQQLGAILPA